MLDQKIDDTLKIAKELFKQCAISNDEYMQDKLMQIIVNISTLKDQKIETKSERVPVTENSEIKKVYRKIPRWTKNPSQYNSIILNTYMSMSSNNEHPIAVDALEEATDLNRKQFLTNYTQMRIMAEKNHAKVFSEEDGVVSLWLPVEKFIVDLYRVTENTLPSKIYESKENLTSKGKKLTKPTINQIIQDIESTIKISLSKVGSKKIIYDGTAEDGRRVIIITPESKIHDNNTGWVDLTRKQINLLKQYDLGLLVFRLANGQVFDLEYSSLVKILKADNMRNSEQSGDHWKFEIIPENSQIRVKGDSEYLDLMQNYN